MLGLGVELLALCGICIKSENMIRGRKLMLLDFQVVIKLLKRLGVK
jgi:hypothetical protein